MSQPLQARCAATGHGDHGDAVRRQRPDGQPVRYPLQGQGRQDCSLNSPPGSRSCHYRGLEQRRCYQQTVTRRARAQDMSSRAGECLITWKCECPPRTRRRSICASREPVKPVCDRTRFGKGHGSCTRQDGLDRTRPVARFGSSRCRCRNAAVSCPGRSSPRCRAPPRRSTRMRSGPTRTPPPIRPVALMTGEPARLGLLDTNIMILRSRIAPGELPDEMAISAVMLAERSAGPHEVRPDTEQGRLLRGCGAGSQAGCAAAG